MGSAWRDICRGRVACSGLDARVRVDQRLAAAARLHELKGLGVRLALDDFGIGYSSLGRLRELPIDILKIDGTFSRDLASREGASLMQAIVYLGQALGLQVIGEGVETAEQAAALQALGCDLAQGFHFGHPAEAAEITALLRTA